MDLPCMSPSARLIATYKQYRLSNVPDGPGGNRELKKNKPLYGPAALKNEKNKNMVPPAKPTRAYGPYEPRRFDQISPVDLTHLPTDPQV